MTQPDEPWLLKKARIAAEMAAKGFRLTVEPKRASRSSGPHPAGDRWFTDLGQAELVEEREGLLGPPCLDCGQRIIKATGKLHKNYWCGTCWGIRQAADDNPAA